MFGWLRGTPKVPDGMLRLVTLPIDEGGAPTWNSEIEIATQRFDADFVVPFMFEIEPGTCIGGFVAKARLQTPVRAYEAIREPQRARRQAETPLIVLCRFPGPALGPWEPDFAALCILPAAGNPALTQITLARAGTIGPVP